MATGTRVATRPATPRWDAVSMNAPATVLARSGVTSASTVGPAPLSVAPTAPWSCAARLIAAASRIGCH